MKPEHGMAYTVNHTNICGPGIVNASQVVWHLVPQERPKYPPTDQVYFQQSDMRSPLGNGDKPAHQRKKINRFCLKMEYLQIKWAKHMMINNYNQTKIIINCHNHYHHNGNFMIVNRLIISFLQNEDGSEDISNLQRHLFHAPLPSSIDY